MKLKELRDRARLALRILRGRDGNLVAHARIELQAAGYFDGDEMNGMMAENIIDLTRVFSAQGHSGFSASFCRQLFSKAAAFEPLGPLTGQDSEWMEIGEQNGGPLWQNKRCGRVFKDRDGAYDIDGVVFEEPNGCCFTGKHSRVRVEFPYSPRTVYAKVSLNADDGEKQRAAFEALAAVV